MYLFAWNNFFFDILRGNLMRKIKPLTKAQYQENFAKIFSVVAQLIVAAFFVAVIIYSIF